MTLELLPPMYNHSTPLPTYSSKPSSNERTLHQTPSRSVRATPSGTYTHKTPKITVVLFDQELDVGLPVYGRNSQLSGYVSVNDPRKVDSVVLKIEGKLSATTSERGSFSLPLLNCSSVLWRQNSGHELPKHLPFSQLLPSTFIYEGSEYPLPPTYSIPKTSEFCVRTKYFIKVCVNRIRGMGSFFAKSDSAKLSFQYRPRTRAHRPILPIPQFFSTVKTSPEEWHQKMVPIKTINANSEPNVLYCHLFIPEVRVFGLTDKIPFHVQINGPLEAIQRYFGPQQKVSSQKKGGQEKTLQPKLKVSLVRQSKIETNGEKVWSDRTIGGGNVGAGEIQELPPSIWETPLNNMWQLDWEGELKVNADVTVGGFAAGGVSVNDFIMLNLEPPDSTPNNQSCLLCPLQVTVPIRFVTDSYVEIADYETPYA